VRDKNGVEVCRLQADRTAAPNLMHGAPAMVAAMIALSMVSMDFDRLV
jgi:hypothetical protein